MKIVELLTNSRTPETLAIAAGCLILFFATGFVVINIFRLIEWFRYDHIKVNGKIYQIEFSENYVHLYKTKRAWGFPYPFDLDTDHGHRACGSSLEDATNELKEKHETHKAIKLQTKKTKERIQKELNEMEA